MDKDLENKILDFAYNEGVCANQVEEISSTKDGTVYYSLCYTDKDGFPIPTGLPKIVILKDNKLKLVFGIEALDLLDSLYDK